MWAGAFIAPWDWRARTASTAILGSYKPTEAQERILLPSTPQLQPKPSLSPRPQVQERRAECLIKGNINSIGEHIYHVPGQRYYDKTQIDASKGERWFCTEQEAVGAGWRKSRVISGGCPHLARRLSGPPLECMRECTHFVKAEQPRNLGYMQLGVIKVSNCQIAPQLLKYFSEVQSFVRKLSGQRPLAHSQTASNVIHHHPSMRKQRRYRVLNSRA